MLSIKNNYNNLVLNYDILRLNDIINQRKVFILFNIKQQNFNLVNLKKLLLKQKCQSGIWKYRLVRKLFSKDLSFLSSSMFCIYVNDFSKFVEVIKLLDNINFFFIYNNRFSNIMNKNIFLDIYNKNNKLGFLHFNIFKLLFNIIIILIYFITTILKYIK